MLVATKPFQNASIFTDECACPVILRRRIGMKSESGGGLGIMRGKMKLWVFHVTSKSRLGLDFHTQSQLRGEYRLIVSDGL